MNNKSYAYRNLAVRKNAKHDMTDPRLVGLLSGKICPGSSPMPRLNRICSISFCVEVCCRLMSLKSTRVGFAIPSMSRAASSFSINSVALVRRWLHRTVPLIHMRAKRLDTLGFNVSLDTLQVILETIFPTNHLTGVSKQNQTTTKL